MNPVVGDADVQSLTSALVDANDQLLALYDLSQVTANTLDEPEAVIEILRRSSRILAADAIELVSGRDVFGTGSRRDRTHLRAALTNHDPGAGDVTAVGASHASGLEAELRVLRRHRPFSTGDRKMLLAVLRTALGAISTARLHRQVLHRALDTRDHQRAAEIAQLALPQWRPDLPATDLFITSRPAQQTGGDLFCFAVDGDDLLFAVGDVAGKGLTAAVMMTTAISAANAAFRDASQQHPSDHMRRIDEWTHDHLSQAGLFMTLFVGRYRASDGLLEWTNAGHSPCLVATTDGWIELSAQTPPIGVFTDLPHRTNTVELDVGELLVIGSDGLVEQEDGVGRPFGDQRLRAFIHNGRNRPLDELGPGLLDAIDEFADHQPPFDDRTLLVLRRQP